LFSRLYVVLSKIGEPRNVTMYERERSQCDLAEEITDILVETVAIRDVVREILQRLQL